MFKVLTPLFALIIAAGLGYTYVRPEFIEIQSIQNETRAYKDAHVKAEELVTVLNQKKAERESLNPVALARLSAMVPEEVDEVSVIMDIDALAQANRMVLSGVAVKKSATSGETAGGEAQSGAETGRTEAQKPESVDIGLTLTGSYEDFRKFMDGLEKSLVLFDVTALDFAETTGDLMNFTMNVRTYSFQLKN